jgi:hypothetical protein
VNRFELTRRQSALRDLSYDRQVLLIIGHLRRAAKGLSGCANITSPRTLYQTPYRAEIRRHE